MSVSKEEMLAELDYLEGAALLPHSERTDAIRALLLAVGEWQIIAGKHENLINLKAVRKLLCDIRDFGEKKK